MLAMRIEEVSKPCVELASDGIGRVLRVRQDARLNEKHEILPERWP